MQVKDKKLLFQIFENPKLNIKEIHDNHYCNFCGACKLICPKDAIEYNDGEIFVNNNCIFCKKCLDICSQNHKIKFSSDWSNKETNSMIKNYNKRMKLVPFGEFKDIFICETLNLNIRSNAMLGGTTLSLLKTALEIGYIDVALVADFSNGNQFPSGKIVKSEKELFKTGGSKYLPTLSLEKLTDLLLDDNIESVGVTALPCQAFVIEKMKNIPETKKYVSKIKLVLSLFCGNGVPSRNDVERLLVKNGAQDSLTSFTTQRQRINRFWRLNPQDKERYIFSSKKEKIDISSRRILGCKPRKNCSSLCPDYTGYYSDISLGGSGLKSNLVVVRTEIGEKIFREAIGRKNIKKRKISGLNYFLINFMGKKKRENIAKLIQQVYT